MKLASLSPNQPCLINGSSATGRPSPSDAMAIDALASAARPTVSHHACAQDSVW